MTNFIPFFVLVASILLLQSCQAQPTNEKSKNLLKTDSTVLSNEPIQILGTQCTIIPPDGFVRVDNFSGVKNLERLASIKVLQLDTSCQEFISGFAVEELTNQGLKIIDEEEIEHNGSRALMFLTSIEEYGITYYTKTLFCGTDDVLVTVIASYTQESLDLEEQITASMLSVKYDSNLDDRLDEASTISFDVGNDFKLVEHSSGDYLYTADGSVGKNVPSLIVLTSDNQLSLQQMGNLTENDIQRLTGTENNKITELNEVKANNLFGMELVSYAQTKNDKKQLVYNVIFFNKDGFYYLITGTTVEEFDKYLAIFRKITKTFKEK
ncbi:hypothetical protein C4F49_00330 [Sphingobacterium sp. KB22]|uniref:DUF1795 domain-containing protein n=2 Tax=Sphingobacterium hungaricum TaxID=2082723 RepID=A0A928URS9_9SPHI|nr:hypothetical protein [Sphingobacterium hungaricum]